MWHSHKFDQDDILEMATMRIQGYSCRQIAQHFACQTITVQSILIGKTELARKVLGRRLLERLADVPQGNRKLTPEQVRHLKRLRGRGYTRPQIADIFEISILMVDKILAGDSYADIE